MKKRSVVSVKGMVAAFFAVCYVVVGSAWADDLDDLRSEAQRGDIEAQCALASKYYEGGNFSQAAYWLNRGLAQGDSFGCCKTGLGLMYLNGQGVPRDKAKGVSLLRQAAAEGNGMAQMYLDRIAR